MQHINIAAPIKQWKIKVLKSRNKIFALQLQLLASRGTAAPSYFLHRWLQPKQILYFSWQQLYCNCDWERYQQRCFVARRAAGPRPRPLWGWSRALQTWRCWSPSAGCSRPAWTPSTGCQCPVWTPWGGGTPRVPPRGSCHHSGRCCRCWWRIRWSSDLESTAEGENVGSHDESNSKREHFFKFLLRQLFRRH